LRAFAGRVGRLDVLSKADLIIYIDGLTRIHFVLKLGMWVIGDEAKLSYGGVA
jgi:hypothetical protein